ncbi:disulfide bond formation protein B [Sphingomicrobium nitratireducens]|uniref:disulfide bond formation protein B n=1 Tax=Sphingomicrobium nitratireducens TaxID=2964666 RepID=UPI00223F16BD|nr:disulfide bond formation protein B [Sphingomicrobium nitratireducens]
MLAPARPAPFLRLENARLMALGIPAALLAGAIGSQYLGGLAPCEMCYWQRYAHGAAMVPALLALATAGRPATSRLLTLLAALGIAVSGAIGIFHAGVEAGLWEGVTTCTSNAVSMEDILAAPLVRCDEVQWSLLGISMAGWNAIVSLGSAALIALAARRSHA